MHQVAHVQGFDHSRKIGFPDVGVDRGTECPHKKLEIFTSDSRAVVQFRDSSSVPSSGNKGHCPKTPLTSQPRAIFTFEIIDVRSDLL